MIRPFELTDATPVADMLRELDEGPSTPAGVRHRVESMPTRADAVFWVAIQDEAVVGWTEARRKWSSDPSIGKFRVVVARAWRRRGIGSELWTCALEHLAGLGVDKLVTYDDGTPESARFVTSRAFRPARRTVISVLEPKPVEVSIPPDTRLHALGEVLARQEELFNLYRTAEVDMPADDAHGRMPLEEWRRETLEHPHLDREGSSILEVGGQLASLTFLLVDREGRRAENEMTGTLPELRGKGLATLCKQASIRWAAENGIAQIWTGNDEENAAMIAVNRRLGYRPVKVLADYSLELETAP